MRPRPRAPRRTRPEVPCAALFWAEAGIPRSEAESPKAMSIRGAEPSKTRRVAQDCDPKAYMYMSSISPEAVGRIAKRALAGCRKGALIGRFSWYPPTTEGRSPRSGCPSRGASTVARNKAARWKANPHRMAKARHKSGAASRTTARCVCRNAAEFGIICT